MPRRERGFINFLQVIRRSGRSQSEDTFTKSRPVDGDALTYLSMRMIEVFQYEQMESIKKGLEKLFPKIEGFTNNQSFKEYFDQIENSINSGSWRSIGIIYRNKKPIISDNTFCLENLPNEVDFIEIGLHKTLPSLIVVTLDIQFNITATNNLKNIQSSKYLPEIQFNDIFLKERFISSRFNTSEQCLRKEVLNYTYGLREKIEIAIRPYVFGEFMGNVKSAPRLPVIEIYSYTTAEKIEVRNFEDWKKRSNLWFESYGFRDYLDVYLNENMAFFWSNDSYFTDDITPNRILIFQDNFLKGNNLQMYGNNEKNAIFHLVKEDLDNSIAPLIILEILKLDIKNLERIRSKIFKTMKDNSYQKPRLNIKFVLFNDFQKINRKISRLLVEFDQNKKYFKNNIFESEIFELIFRNRKSDLNKEAETLEINIYNRIKYLRKILTDHLKYIKESFSTYIELLNASEIYRLQKYTILLAIIAIIIAMLNFHQIQEKIALILNLFIEIAVRILRKL